MSITPESAVSSSKKPSRFYPNLRRHFCQSLSFCILLGLRSDIAVILSRNPNFLTRSLHNSLIPRYDSLRSLSLVDENIHKIFKRSSWEFLHHVPKNVFANI
ncbi:hypothetical protein ACOSQ3_000342 [Xanthoceras sorbifolium]